MRNLSVFEMNVVHALQGAAETEADLENCEAMFFRFKDRCRAKAERMALKWAEIAPLHNAVMGCGCRVSPFAVAVNDVSDFVRERFVRTYFPDGRSA